MITIVELPGYIKKADSLLGKEERDNVVRHLSLNPQSGVLIKGTGGIRKIGWAREGMGKSGGARIIYFYHNENMPVFLLTAFGKNEKANLSDSEKNDLAKLATLLVNTYNVRKK